VFAFGSSARVLPVALPPCTDISFYWDVRRGTSVIGRVCKTINNRLALLLARDFEEWSAATIDTAPACKL
jgi:hypothetical protein